MIKTITGNNRFEMHRELIRAIDEFKSENNENSVDRYDMQNMDMLKIRDSLSGLSLFSPRSLVVVSGVGIEKPLQEKFMELIQAAPNDSDLIIHEPEIDKRSKYYKFLKENTNLVQYDELPQAGLITWIIEQAKQYGGNISRPTAQFLVDYVGGDQWLLGNELQKLSQGGDEITKDLIQELCEPLLTENIFQLLDQVAANNKQKSLHYFEQLRAQKVDPYYILTMIIWSLHNMLIVQQAKDKVDSQIASDTRMSPYVISKTRGSVRNISSNQLAKMVDMTASTDLQLKTSSVDPDDAVRNLILKLTSIF